jgi:hypothetical protein
LASCAEDEDAWSFATFALPSVNCFMAEKCTVFCLIKAVTDSPFGPEEPFNLFCNGLSYLG